MTRSILLRGSAPSSGTFVIHLCSMLTRKIHNLISCIASSWRSVGHLATFVDLLHTQLLKILQFASNFSMKFADFVFIWYLFFILLKLFDNRGIRT